MTQSCCYCLVLYNDNDRLTGFVSYYILHIYEYAGSVGCDSLHVYECTSLSGICFYSGYEV